MAQISQMLRGVAWGERLVVDRCFVLSLGQNGVGFQTEQHIKQIAARWRGSQIPQISQMLRGVAWGERLVVDRCFVLSLGQNGVGFQTEQHIKHIAAR
ncbi:hypothetical protein HMPREF9136_2214 [Prevotella dentalis DSM 3688]|uniref:Uncharacterized protein n=1 Tax=Prevotella dentalis (strain ATCC 49559 / DSM 3688 / JCM 13448 / NCTC 12043 / ES 2772) TaxID=908937 RepID=F9D5T6_PREDD|nr:hypothetical protein [Prevotella dentalis]EGQ12959.1 hypothetical protein HMPREF9136_2214 [Prevotella dentalis DSM 3688]